VAFAGVKLRAAAGRAAGGAAAGVPSANHSAAGTIRAAPHGFMAPDEYIAG
jgi:hypothetical protein